MTGAHEARRRPRRPAPRSPTQPCDTEISHETRIARGGRHRPRPARPRRGPGPPGTGSHRGRALGALGRHRSDPGHRAAAHDGAGRPADLGRGDGLPRRHDHGLGRVPPGLHRRGGAHQPVPQRRGRHLALRVREQQRPDAHRLGLHAVRRGRARGPAARAPRPQRAAPLHDAADGRRRRPHLRGRDRGAPGLGLRGRRGLRHRVPAQRAGADAGLGRRLDRQRRGVLAR